ncbi:MAG: ATP-grasp domain-containing protein [Planctomycetota bacterium]|jgi:FMN phosphatase YigB (HAD superfamily)|nr:ATP-grasp domain-containing protein [Planctomycetota bacterium]
MKKVLVFPCGSEIGLELARSLSVSAHFALYGASSVADHGEFAYENYLERLPLVRDPAFPEALNRLLEKYAIDYVYPAHDDVAALLARLRDEARLAAEVVAPGGETAGLCRSKSATYARFSGLLRVPRVYAAAELPAIDGPIFLKPDSGQGSKGTFLAPDRAAALERLRERPRSLALEFLPGREFTVDCFTDRHGALRFASARERLRVANGISVRTAPVESPRLLEMAEIVNGELALRGPWFFQAREDKSGEPGLLEIAPRIAGASGLQRARGVNLALLGLYDRMGLEVEVPAPLSGVALMDRALENRYRLDVRYAALYIDLDDTLVVRGKVNLDAVRLLYQCFDRGVKTVLLTRRREGVESALRRRRLSGLFDHIVEVPGGAPKSAFITEREAVFIDDSFAERREVKNALGIPTFDPSAIEALLDS